MDERYDREQVEGFSFVRETYDWVESAVMAFVAMILVLTFVARMVSVEGASMENTLHENDRLISSNLFYKPKYGDIVVVVFLEHAERPLIKRVIATGGQVVDIDFETGVVMVDGEVLDEPYIAEPTNLQYDIIFPVLVPQGHVFVMGDNRNHSWDSRDSEIGMVDERNLLGRVVYRVMPFDKMGLPSSVYQGKNR